MKKSLSLLMLLATMMLPWMTQAQECIQSIPFSEGFETVEATSSYSTAGTLPLCWEGYSNGTNYNYMPHVVFGSSNYCRQHSGQNCLIMTSGSESYGNTKMVLLPPMEVALNQLYLSFWFYTESATHGVLTVGYLTGDDTSTFTPIAYYPASEATSNGLYAWDDGLEVDLALSDLPDAATRLAFRWEYGTSYWSCCIDDVVVSYPPACPRIEQLTSEASSTEVLLSWIEMGSATNWEVTIMDDTSVVSTTIVTTTPATIGNLTPNTRYSATVRAFCDDSNFSLIRTTHFRTQCVPVDSASLPWTYGFEDATGSGSSHSFSQCLGRHAVGTSVAYPYATSSNPHSGDYHLYMYSYNDTYSYLTLPLFETPLSNLQLSFWAYASNSSNYGHWTVGVMSDPDDLSTFEPIASGQATNEWELVEVPLASYTGTGTYLAILCPSRPTSCYTYIDDITVDYLPTCLSPLGVTATNITSTSATFAINDPAMGGTYRVYFADDSVTVNTTTFSLTLSPNTDYTIRVRTLCSDSTTTAAVRTTVTTPCEAIATFPWIEDFDSISNINDLACWKRYTGLYNDTADFQLSPYTSGWTLYSNHGMDSSQHVKVNIYSTSTDYWLMTPLFELGSGMELSFEYSLTAYNHDEPNNAVMDDDRFIVFLVTTDGNFIPLAQWGSDSLRDDYSYKAISNSINGINIPLNAYAGQQVRFAFYGESTVSGDDNDLHIDNVYVGPVVNCPRPNTVWMSNVTTNEATIHWSDPAATGSYTVVYYPVDQTWNSDTSYVTGATSLTIFNLTSSTEYVVKVMSVCDQPTTPRTRKFRTACDPIADLPWFEDFESSPRGGSTSRLFPYCMTRLNNALTYFGYPYVDQYALDNHTPNGVKGLYWNIYSNSSNGEYQCVVLPAVDTALYPVNSLQLRFWSHAYQPNQQPVFQFGVMTDPHDINSFQLVKEVNISGITFKEYTVAFNSFSGEGQYIAIKAVAPASNWSASIDDITLEVRPACTDVVNLAASTTVKGALLTWNQREDYDAPDGYMVTYNTIDATGAPTVVNVTTNNAVLANLTPGTTYKAYVQANCGGDGMGRTDSILFTTHSFDCAQYDPATLDTVNVGDTTFGISFNTANYMPVGNYYKYSYTQQIILASELHGAATLNGIAFEYLYELPTSTKTDVTIYLANVSDSTLEFSFVNFNDSAFRPVYHGPLNCSQGWNQFEFDTPFAYDGTSNLLLVVHDNSGAYDKNLCRFATHPSWGMARYIQRDNSPYFLGNIIGGTVSDRANMRLYSGDCQFTATCATPAVEVAGVTSTTATLVWAAGADETAWDIAYRYTGDENWTNAVTGVTGNTFTVSGLDTVTTYDFLLSFVCSDASGNSYATTVSATTLSASGEEEIIEVIDNMIVDTLLTEGMTIDFHGLTVNQPGVYVVNVPGKGEFVLRASAIINAPIGQGTVTLGSNVADGAWIGPDDLLSQPLPTATALVEPMRTQRYLFTRAVTSETLIDNGDFERGYWLGESLTPDYSYQGEQFSSIGEYGYGYVSGYGKNGSIGMVVSAYDDSTKYPYSITLPTTYGHTYRLTYSSKTNCITCGIPKLVMCIDGEPKTAGDMVTTWHTYSHTFVAQDDYTTVGLRWKGNSFGVLPMNITLDDISIVDLMSSDDPTDTITVTNRHILVYDTTWASICLGDTFYTDGQEFSLSGLYLLTPQIGVDSSFYPALALFVREALLTRLADTICDGEEVHFGSQILTTEGLYADTLTSLTGCDSIVSLHLTVNPTYQVADTLFACDNQLPYLYQGTPLDTAGIHILPMLSAAGCDSTVTVTLNVGATYQHENQITLCQSGMPYVYGDQTFDPETPSGTYNVMFSTVEGCDSVINLDLTVHESEQTEIYVVTVQNTHNLVLWETEAAIEHYNIYRESTTSGLYSLVAQIPYDEGGFWIDEGSDARARSYRYRMTSVDSCGAESDYSVTHKTMHLTINQGQGNSWNLVWTEYEGTSYSTYRIYRGTSYSNLQLIDEMPAGGNTTYTDNTAPWGNVYYQIVVLLSSGTKGNTKDGDDGTIRSNIATNDETGIDDVEDLFSKVYTQHGDIVVETTVGLTIQVFDVTGRRLHDAVSTGKDLFDVPTTGVYMVRIAGAKARRVVVEK